MVTIQNYRLRHRLLCMCEWTLQHMAVIVDSFPLQNILLLLLRNKACIVCFSVLKLVRYFVRISVR